MTLSRAFVRNKPSDGPEKLSLYRIAGMSCITVTHRRGSSSPVPDPVMTLGRAEIRSYASNARLMIRRHGLHIRHCARATGDTEL